MRLYPTTNGSELRQLSRQLCIEVCPFYNGGTEQCKINQITISGARREFVVPMNTMAVQPTWVIC